MDALNLSIDTASTWDVRALLERNASLMREGSREESCHVLDPATLMERVSVLIAARADVILQGIGALTVIGPKHGELKSLHTRAEARGKGVAQALLETLIDHARDTGLARLSLETGTAETFAPARGLYQRNGFVSCPPFGSYSSDPLSIFMTRLL